jgi:hypothetical protein
VVPQIEPRIDWLFPNTRCDPREGCFGASAIEHEGRRNLLEAKARAACALDSFEDCPMLCMGERTPQRVRNVEFDSEIRLRYRHELVRKLEVCLARGKIAPLALEPVAKAFPFGGDTLSDEDPE